MKYVMSGSWNPLHHQHLNMAHYVEHKFKTEVVFEMCCSAYDKEPLSEDEVEERQKQFKLLGRQLVVSDNRSFLEKSSNSAKVSYGININPHLTHNLTFITGFDTISRVNDPKYYFNSETEKSRVLQKLKSQNVRFFVFPRKGKLTEGLSEEIKELCDFAGDDFEEIDISSTELRNNKDYDINGYQINKNWLNDNAYDLWFKSMFAVKSGFVYDDRYMTYTNKYTGQVLSKLEYDAMGKR